MMATLKTADKAWIAAGLATVVFELKSDDLLSEATERYCAKHPLLTRVVIGAIAGHLACVLPPHIDVFSAKNLLHRGVVYTCAKRNTIVAVFTDTLPRGYKFMER
jgi:hypothetical protein